MDKQKGGIEKTPKLCLECLRVILGTLNGIGHVEKRRVLKRETVAGHCGSCL